MHHSEKDCPYCGIKQTKVITCSCCALEINPTSVYGACSFCPRCGQRIKYTSFGMPAYITAFGTHYKYKGPLPNYGVQFISKL